MTRRYVIASAVCAISLFVRCSFAFETPGYRFGGCALQNVPRHSAPRLRSFYISMRDGVRIAVDVALPEDLENAERLPTLLQMTRYWRSREGDGPSDLERFWTSRGYAVVIGD